MIYKTDWTLVKEAEAQGLMVSMTSVVERIRTELNNELHDYFREQMPTYLGSFDEDKAEDILIAINEYVEENNIDKDELDFPLTSGSEIYLIPINKNIQLKVLVVDEYFGDAEYSKYITANYFTITENTNKEDVDVLINFIKEYIEPIN